jgi:hypothetical protein
VSQAKSGTSDNFPSISMPFNQQIDPSWHPFWKAHLLALMRARCGDIVLSSVVIVEKFSQYR